jgi:hypothetical protein
MSWCVFSSLSFITNSIAAYYYGEYIYSVLCGLLCVSSISMHGLRWFTDNHLVSLDELYNNTNITHRLLYWVYLLDKLFVYFVVFSGGCLAYKRINNLQWGSISGNSANSYSIICIACIASTFLLTLLLYYYGDACKIFVFDPQPDVADKWHCLIHWISSFGHHCILLL